MTAALLPAAVSPVSYALISAMVFVAACLQGVGGIGFAMFCAPIAGFFFPFMAPAPLLVLGGTLSLMSVIREPGHVDWPLAGHGIAGRLVGGALAVALVALAPVRYFSISYGVLLLAAVLLTLLGWRVQATRANATAAGVVSGLMGTITSAGAPPFAIVTQSLEPPRIRATVGMILAVGATASLLMLAAAGRFSVAELLLSLSLYPWIMLGFLLSSRLGRRISSQAVRLLLLAMAGFGAVGILVKAAL